MGVNCGGQICVFGCGAICMRALRWELITRITRAANRLRQRGVQAGQCRVKGPARWGMRHVGNCSSHLLRNPRVLQESRARGRACARCAQKWPLFLFQYLAALQSGCDRAWQASAGRPCRCPRPSYAPGPLCCFGTILLCFLLCLRGFNTLGALHGCWVQRTTLDAHPA